MRPSLDRDGFDFWLHAGETFAIPCIAVQVKSCRTLKERNDCWVYDLSAKAFKYLGAPKPNGPPRYLFLAKAPQDPLETAKITEMGTTFPMPIYWHSLEGQADGSEPSSQKRIYVPRANLLTPDALSGLVAGAEAGYTPMLPRQDAGGAR
ncbi:DUF4365 domain-containing protein [Glycomyces tenuis]|uniref:DUF4365 domain-containing protein n=1 Tax=Glycomyces tenuis TaxID=58116 RepID=UPI0009DBE8A9